MGNSVFKKCHHDDQERLWECSRLKKDKETGQLNAIPDPGLDSLLRGNAVRTLLKQLTKMGNGQSIR